MAPVATLGCTNPTPLKCKWCSRGNWGIGYDHCRGQELLRQIVTVDQTFQSELIAAKSEINALRTVLDVQAKNEHGTIKRLESELCRTQEALRDTLGVLTEPGIMDVDEWKKWRNRTVIVATRILANVEKKS